MLRFVNSLTDDWPTKFTALIFNLA